ncbi:UNVERIFIED_CONTAM: hypothetical protein FKN15_042750, partial [Acipenser sinensis]
CCVVFVLQLDLVGQSVFDFIHPCDQEELRDILTPRQRERGDRRGGEKTLRGSAEPPLSCLTVLCEPIPDPSRIDFPLDRSAFLSRHSMDLCVTQCDESAVSCVSQCSDVCVFLFQECEDLDRDMLAPYISMDDDFQLAFLTPNLEPDPPRSGTAKKRGKFEIPFCLTASG